MTRRRLLLAIALFALAAVGAALVSQHGFDMQPCPWCVLQRLVFVAIAAAALVGLLVPVAGALLVLALALAGAAAALWQHFVAVSAESCDLTLADRIMAASGLDAAWPGVFMATATCAEAQVELLGLDYELWSLAAFVLIAAAALAVLRSRR